MRVDGSIPVSELLGSGFGLAVRFLEPVGVRVGLELSEGVPAAALYRKSEANGWVKVEDPRARAAVGRVAEFEIPFAILGATTGDRVAMFVTMTRQSAEFDRQPRHQAIEFEVPDQWFASRTWTA